MFTKYKEN
jgi:hypothetical protein